jgi:hypothetical protein
VSVVLSSVQQKRASVSNAVARETALLRRWS